MESNRELNKYSRFDVNEKISTASADEALRGNESFRNGEVVVAHNLVDILQIDRGLLETIEPNWREYTPSYLLEIIESYGYSNIDIETEDELFKLVDQIKYLDALSDVIEQIKRNGPQNERQKVIVETYGKYLSLKLDMNVDNVDISVVTLINFVSYFKSEFEDIVEKIGVKEKVINSQESLIDILESGKDIPLIKKKDRLRIAEDVKRMPIVIEDTLTAEINWKINTSDRLGYFTPETRVCYVDPIAIASNYKDLFDERLSQVVYHELFHAATMDVYELRKFKDQEEDWLPTEQPFIYRKVPVWPKFLYEAMVEKLAIYCLAPTINLDKIYRSSAVRSEDRLMRTIFGDLHPVSKEEVWRLEKNQDNSVEHMLVSRKHKFLSEIIPKSYREYRLLVDLIIQQVDWESIGITTNQAEKMLVDAFLERPENETRSDKRWPKRKRFMSAVNEATSPGFFNRLTRVVEQLGPSEAIKILSSSTFDSKDIDAIPFLISTEKYRVLAFKGGQKLLDSRRSRLKRLQDHNAPQNIIDEAQREVVEAINSSVALHNYEQVLRGLKAKINNGEKPKEELADILVYEKWQRDRKRNL